jgi:hypothetical protein
MAPIICTIAVAESNAVPEEISETTKHHHHFLHHLWPWYDYVCTSPSTFPTPLDLSTYITHPCASTGLPPLDCWTHVRHHLSLTNNSDSITPDPTHSTHLDILGWCGISIVLQLNWSAPFYFLLAVPFIVVDCWWRILLPSCWVRLGPARWHHSN